MKTGVAQHFVNFLLFGLVVYFVIQKGPVFYEHFQEEGKPAPRILIPKLDGSIFDSESINEKNGEKKGLVLVFWATWCPPCEVELKRINNLIQQGDVPSDSVIAISIQEDPNLVARVAKDRDYKFQIAVSSETTLAKLFKVAGTPTIIVRPGLNALKADIFI